MSKIKKLIVTIIIILVTAVLLYAFLSIKKKPDSIQYGVSFNTLYAIELGLDWKKVFDSIIEDLNVKHFRLAVHWDMTEPKKDVWNFEEIDYQVKKAQENDAEIIMAVGRRLPRWPECHTPLWAQELSWEDKKEEIREYLEVVINRYKGYENITYWQVENEPFLEVFATEHCGQLDVDFLDEEIALVRELDPSRQILVTDSGNLGTWARPYKRGDAFGTSVYVYLWNPTVGPFKSFLPPSFYRAKNRLVEIVFGNKESMLIELSLEPWLLQPVVKTPLETQLNRMDIKKFNEIIDFAKDTRYQKQYLWGAEWWYYMKQNGQSEFWDSAEEIFNF